MKLLGFKRTVIVSITLLVAMCLFMSNWAYYVHIRDGIIQNINLQSQSTVKYEARKIENWFLTKALAIDSLASHYTSGRVDNNYVDIAKLIKSANGLTTVMFGFDDGRSYSTAIGDSWINGVGIFGKYDPRSQPWYQQAKTVSSLDVTDVYLDSATGEPVVSIVKNLGDGMVLGDLTLSILTDTMNSIKFPGAVTAIFDGTGTALASNSSKLAAGTRLIDIGMADAQKAMLSQDESYTEYWLNGVEKLFFTKSIKLVNGKKWYLSIGVDKSVAYAAADGVLNEEIVYSLLMVLIAALLIIVILNVLCRPILLLKEVVLDLSNGSGDLTRRLPVTSNDDLGQISEGINIFIAKLQCLMLEVSHSTEHISRSVEQLKAQANTNNQVITAHSTETEQIVTAIEELSTTASDVAHNASEASQFVHHTNSQVSNSKAIVTEATYTASQMVDEVKNTSARIAEIGKDTSEITNVLAIIGEIADQTNLLALNAAIEAARAGDQGRGFAVVADEVRALAARTQSSTAEIEQTLDKLRKGSDATIDAMGITKSTCEKTEENATLLAKSLGTVDQAMDHINDLSTQIATAAEQQSSVTDEISRNMAAIREIVAELATSGDATTSETISLAAANSQLKSVVSKFRLE